jgi:hypothetical protein
MRTLYFPATIQRHTVLWPYQLGYIIVCSSVEFCLNVATTSVLKPNSWTYNFVEVSGHNLESSGIWGFCTAKTQYRKFETNTPRKGIARPQSPFPHSCVCEQYSHDQSAYSAAGKYVDRSWEYINRSQTHECGNWNWGRAISFLGLHEWDFCCNVYGFRQPRKGVWFLSGFPPLSIHYSEQ